MIPAPKLLMLGIFTSLFSLLTYSAIPASTNDLWDVSAGVRISATSKLRGGFQPHAIFGANTSIEIGQTVFADWQPPGSAHFVEWETTQPIRLTRIHLFASGDGPAYNHQREFGQFVLKAKRNLTDPYITVHSFAPSHPYVFLDSESAAILAVDVPAIDAQFFRAEFVQWTSGTPYDGPRVIELDGFGSVLQAQIPQSTNDLWDISSGTVITGSSGLRSGFHESDAFGTTFSTEIGQAVFADGATNGATHFIEWKTASPIRLTNFNIFASGDGEIYNHEREFGQFVLKAKLNDSNAFQTVYTFSPQHPYEFLDPVSHAIISTNIAPIDAQLFRAEFVQWNAGRGYDGPRVIEMDAYGTILQPRLTASTNDLWDTAQGATFLGSSGLRSGFFGSDAFGTFRSLERGSLIFRDTATNGYTHFAEWKSIAPIRLTGFHLFAQGDGPAFNYQREFERFVLKAKPLGSGEYQTIYTFHAPSPLTNLDTVSGALLFATVPEIDAQFFRAEFVQRNAGRGFDGPRVIELDAIATFLPETRTTVADWTFEEGIVGQPATNIIDSSSNLHHASGLGTSYASGAGVDSGTIALRFINGAFFSPPRDQAFKFLTNDFTLETIVHPSGLGTNQTIISGQNPNDGGLAYVLGYDGQSRLVKFSLITSNGFVQFVSVPLPNDGSPHHIAASRRGSTLAIYLDKQLAQSKDALIFPNFPLEGPLDFRVGATSAGNWFEGTLERVRVSKGALLPDEFIPFTPAPVRIFEQPRSQSVLVGTDVTFFVRVEPTSGPTFQWLFNGSALPGRTNSILVLTNVQPAASGHYSVAASLDGKTVESDSAQLIVSAPVTDKPVQNDLFDVSEGNRVIHHSGMFPSVSAAGMFGDDSTSREPGSTIFADGLPNGVVHSIEWRTPSAVNLRAFKLFAGGDGAEYFHQREFDQFRLLAKSSPYSTNFDRVVYSHNATHPYVYVDPTNYLLLDISLPDPVTAQEFRAEFVQWNAGRGYDGPRVIELDGFGEAIGAPSPVVADWTFEEGAVGTQVLSARDSSPNALHITQVVGSGGVFVSTDEATAGAISVSLPSVAGGIGNALRGPDSLEFHLGPQFTLEASLTPGPDNATWNRGVLVGQDAASGRLVYALDYRSEQRSLNFVVVNAQGETDFVTVTLPDDGRSHHVAGVYSNGALKIYLDHVLIAAKATTVVPGLTPGGAGRVSLGANDIGGYWFQGVLDRVRISREALAPEDFFQHRRDPATPVTIIQPLENLSVAAGDIAAFQVIATGPGALAYQWFFNGESLSNQSSNTLVLSNVQSTNSGTYKVTVTSGLWEASSSATLTVTNRVLTAPAILQQPSARVAFAGGAVQFSVIAAGSPPLAYQWKFNDEIIEGATASTLGLTNLSFTNAGFYSVRVSNDLGFTNSAAALLTVLPADLVAPVITITSPAPGSTSSNRVTLAGTVSDNQEISHVEWIRNGQVIGPVTLVNGAFIIPELLLNTGTNVFAVRAFDLAGNSATGSVEVTLQMQRSISVGAAAPVQEGARVSFPIQVSSSGDIAALSFSILYDTNYLAEPFLNWQGLQPGAFSQVNSNIAGAIHATYVLPGSTIPSGDNRVLANVRFRARSVPENLTVPITLDLHGVYSAAGNPITSGTTVNSGEVQITRRKFIGDNNANDRLDIGDATAVIRMLTLLDPTRAWDVTGNDLNNNTSLDAGDIVRVLRAVVNLDPQPTAGAGLLAAASIRANAAAAASLSADRTRITPGQPLRLKVSLAGLSVPLSGVSFRLEYPANALFLGNSTAHLAGAAVPNDALALWNIAPNQDYSTQSGTLHFAASTATSWASNSGEIADLTFTVRDSALTQYAWPVRLHAEVASGMDVVTLATAALTLTGRDAEPAQLADIKLNAAGTAFELRLVGEAGVRYRIETSIDLVEWTELQSTSDVSGVIQVSDPVNPLASRKFYRAIELD